MARTDRYYAVLGLSPGASKEEVKRAYRALVLRYHPDRNDDPDAVERFLAIEEAYTVLTDTSGTRRIDADLDARRRARREREARKRAERRRKREEYLKRKAARERRMIIRDMTRAAILLAIVVAIILATRVPGLWEARRLRTQGIQNMATVVEVGFKEYVSKRVTRQEVLISFPHMGSDVYQETMMVHRSERGFTAYGFPLNPGQTFEMTYLPRDVNTFEVHWDRPGLQTLDTYNRLLIDFMGSMDPDMVASGHARAYLDSVYRRMGMDGYGIMGNDYPKLVAPRVHHFVLDRELRHVWAIRRHFLEDAR